MSDYLRSVAAVGNTTVHEPERCVLTGLRLSQSFEPVGLPHERQPDVRRYERDRALSRSGARREGDKLPNSLFSLYGIKIVGDGSNQTETGAQTRPYLDTDNNGSANYDAAQMKQMVAEVKAAGLPVLIHCNGDHTIDISLDAMEAAYGGSRSTGLTASNIRRWRGPTRSSA